MNINEIEKIIPKEKILQNVQMKKYTSFKIGGEAEVLIKISTLEELTKIIKYASFHYPLKITVPLTYFSNPVSLLLPPALVRLTN